MGGQRGGSTGEARRLLLVCEPRGGLLLMVDASQMPHHLGPAANVLNGMGDMFVMGGKEISNCLVAPSSISADGVTSVKDQTTLNLLAGVALDNKARASMMSRNESHFDPRLFAPHGKRGRFADGIDPTRGLAMSSYTPQSQQPLLHDHTRPTAAEQAKLGRRRKRLRSLNPRMDSRGYEENGFDWGESLPSAEPGSSSQQIRLEHAGPTPTYEYKSYAPEGGAVRPTDNDRRCEFGTIDHPSHSYPQMAYGGPSYVPRDPTHMQQWGEGQHSTENTSQIPARQTVPVAQHGICAPDVSQMNILMDPSLLSDLGKLLPDLANSPGGSPGKPKINPEMSKLSNNQPNNAPTLYVDEKRQLPNQIQQSQPRSAPQCPQAVPWVQRNTYSPYRAPKGCIVVKETLALTAGGRGKQDSGKAGLRYSCGYCGQIKSSASTGKDGRIRIRCECGGKYRDNTSRMHAMWNVVRYVAEAECTRHTSTQQS